MYTAITYAPHAHYFGRNLDLNVSYNEQVTITPRHYPFNFRRMGENANHYAMIGIATVVQDYPLYYEATNEKGLSMAGLNFPGMPCSSQKSTDETTSLPSNSFRGFSASARRLRK